jgi:hypothetical protein
VAEGIGRGDRAQAANRGRGAAQVRAEAAVHRHAHVVVDPVARVIADGIGQHARRQHPYAIEFAPAQHHLVERRHAACRSVAAAARRAGATPGVAVALGQRTHALAIGRGLVHVRDACVFAFGQADEDVRSQAQRSEDRIANIGAEILAGELFDQHAQRPVSRQAVVVDARPGCPFEGELADGLAHAGVIGPRLAGQLGVREAALVGDDLQDRDVALAQAAEFGHVIAQAVGEAECPLFGELPQCGQHHLGVRVQQPQGVGAGGHRLVAGAGLAERALQQQLAVPRERDLRPG